MIVTIPVPLRNIPAELLIPSFIAEQFTLASAAASQPEFGSLRILILAFSNPAAASMSVLWTASTAICGSLSTFARPSQSIMHRRAALRQYDSAINAIRQALQVYQGSDLPLTTAVILLALFELSAESDEHDTAWRHHLGGAHSLAASLHPTGEARKGRPSCLLRNAIFDLRDLAAAMDNLFDNATPPRKLDARKLRVDVSKIHKQLLILKHARERGYAESKPTSTQSAAFAWRLNILTALLLTTRFLIDTSQYLSPSRGNPKQDGTRNNTLCKLRATLLAGIGTTTSLLLSRGTVSDLPSLSAHLHAILHNTTTSTSPRPPNTIEALTAIYPLALSSSLSRPPLHPHSHVPSHQPTSTSTSPIPVAHQEQHLAPTILKQLTDLCSIPKASSVLTQTRFSQPLGYKQVLDALAVVAMGSALS